MEAEWLFKTTYLIHHKRQSYQLLPQRQIYLTRNKNNRTLHIKGQKQTKTIIIFLSPV